MRIDRRLVMLSFWGTLFTLIYAMVGDNLPLYLGIPAILTTAYLAGGALLWVKVVKRVIKSTPRQE